jgi:hypothetical protein
MLVCAASRQQDTPQAKALPLKRCINTGEQGAVMKIGNWAWFVLAAAPLLTGCGDFWQAPSNGTSGTSFSLSNGGGISIAPGATTNNTSTITVTPANSFTGTVTLSCSVTGPSGATSPTTCALSPTSVSITDTNAQQSTLTATTTSTTTLGSYQILVTGVSGSTAETTTVCADVSTSGAACPATATTSGNFYILNNGAPAQIFGESIVSGTVTPISGSPWSLAGIGTPYSIAIAPNGNFLYVSTDTGVWLFSITNGALGAAVEVDNVNLSVYAVQVDTTDSWLIEAIQTTGGVALNALPIDATTGEGDTTRSASSASYGFTTGSVKYGQLAISQDDNYAFVALGAAGAAVFPFNANSPFPSGTVPVNVVQPVHSGGGALSVAVDPSATPRMFYVGESLANSADNGGALRVFNYSTIGNQAGLTQATGSPIATGGTAPNFILPVTSPDYIYVAAGNPSGTAGNIAGFAVSTSGATYTVAAGPVAQVGTQPVGLALDGTGSFVLEVQTGTPYFDSFTFDATTTGKLDPGVTSTTAANPIAIVAAPPAQ